MSNELNQNIPLNKRNPLPKGWRKCITCKEPYQVGTSPVTRSCNDCHTHPKISPDGFKKCIVCKTEFKKSSKYAAYCTGDCCAKDQKRKRSTLKGRLTICLSKAKRRRKCTIDLVWLISQWEKQKGKCYYTGWQMELNSDLTNFHPTLERLDSSKDYTPENVVLCCRQTNWAKNSYSMKDFIEMCRAVIINECNIKEINPHV
jgi:hypothetical protein